MLSRFSLYFEEVARRGSIRQASDHLRIASSAIDRQLLQMEARMGVKLFERTPQGLRLTSAGELMLDTVRRWHREMATLKSRIEDLRGLRRGGVAVAAVEGALEFLSSSLTLFSQDFPGISYRLRIAGAQTVTDDIVKGESEIGLTINVKASSGLRIEHSLAYTIGAVVQPGHPLSAHKEVRITECNDYPLIMPAESISLRAVIEDAWGREAGAVPRAIAVADSIGAIKSLAKAGLGVGILTRMDAISDISDGHLVFVNLLGRNLPISVLSVVSVPGRPLSVPATLLLQHIVKAMAAQENVTLAPRSAHQLE